MLTQSIVALLLFWTAICQGNRSGWLDLAEYDYSIKLDEKVFQVGARPKADLSKKTCVVRRPLAEALSRVQAGLKLDGYGLKVLRCHEPVASVAGGEQWRECGGREEHRHHARGVSVDVTVVDRSGSEVLTPTKGQRGKKTSEERAALKLRGNIWARLVVLMQREGLVASENAMQHFSLGNWAGFPEEEAVSPPVDHGTGHKQ